jgi:hypothetical protein
LVSETYFTQKEKLKWLQCSEIRFLPDLPPLAGLVYILNFPFVCLSVCPTRKLHDREWSDQKVDEQKVAILLNPAKQATSKQASKQTSKLAWVSTIIA